MKQLEVVKQQNRMDVFRTNLVGYTATECILCILATKAIPPRILNPFPSQLGQAGLILCTT